METPLSFFSCPVCGALLTEPAPPCPQCELMESAKARGLDIGPWPPNNPPQVKTCIAPQANIDPPREDGLIQTFEELYNVAWARYGLPVSNWENQIDEKEAIYHKVGMVSWELDKRKKLAKEKGDYPGFIQLRYEHNYLDMRLIDWENGGPDPFLDLPEEGWVSLGVVMENCTPIFEFINFWWEKEPFLLFILENRVEQRMDRLISDSIEIPKNERTSFAYNNFINTKFKEQSQLFEGDITNGLLANAQWGDIYESEIIQLLLENEDFKKIKKDGYFLTIIKATSKDLPSIFKLIAWDRTWLTCRWIQEIITKNAYDNDFNQSLADNCSGKPGCLKKIKKELIQVKKDSQFLYDRFFCGKDIVSIKKEMYEFINMAESFPDTYQGPYKDREDFRKFLIRNLRL